MTTPQVEPTRQHPRRRPLLNTDPANLSAASSSDSCKMTLKKGETFHTPTSPPSGDRDPVLTIRSLPRRSPTTLEAVAAGEQRIISILDRLTLESPDERQPDSQDSSHGDLPVPRGILDAHSGFRPSTPSSSSSDGEEGRDLSRLQREKRVPTEHCHESDSGLGSSISSAETVSTLGKIKGKY